MAASRPLCRSQRRSARVLLVPGRTTRSGTPSSRQLWTYRTPRAGCSSSREKSVKLEMRGRRMTAMSRALRSPWDSSREARESSSSRSTRR